MSRTKQSVPPYQFTQNVYSISRTLDVSNKFVGPLKVRDIESLLYTYTCRYYKLPSCYISKRNYGNGIRSFIILDHNLKSYYPATIVVKNNETNDKFYRKVAFPRYTESVKFMSQN